jgi:nucleoside-diphosphate-sugar epimerase
MRVLATGGTGHIAHRTTDRAGVLPVLVALAKEKGFAGYPGDGANPWNAVHARDVASVFRLALEKGPAGKYWHAVGDEGIPLREIAEAIGSRLDLPAVSIPADELMAPAFPRPAQLKGLSCPPGGSAPRYLPVLSKPKHNSQLCLPSTLRAEHP